MAVPPVFAHDADSAAELLTEAGLEVTRQPLHSCLTPRRAVRTTPAAGTLARPGDPVTMVVTVPHPTAFFVFPDVLFWELLDFANGRGPAPSFASEVTVFVDGQRTTMTGAEASGLDSWRADSALGILAEATRQQVVTDDFTSTPRMKLEPDEGIEFTCGGHGTPEELEGRRSRWFNIAIPTYESHWSCTFADVYQTDEQIDAIVVRTAHTLEGDE